MVVSKRPIYFQLSGRMGNQLFQLAFAHKLAHQFDRKVQFITDHIHYPKVSEFDLVSAKFECEHVLPARPQNSIGYIIRILDKLNAGKFARLTKTITRFLGIHRQLDSHISVAEIRGVPWLVTGFYIDQKLVEAKESILYDEVTKLLKQECSDSRWVNEIENLGEFQMMHVRRGDYLNNRADFGILTANYYRSQKSGLPLVLALENIEDLDDLELVLEPSVILTKENSSPWEALYCMSQAHDLVMSNSTFSWWGGFLATNNGGVARMPTPYFNRETNVDRFFKYKYFSEVASEFSGE